MIGIRQRGCFDDIVSKFDSLVGPKGCALVGFSSDSENMLANSVRLCFGLAETEMSNVEAIKVALSPSMNHYLEDSLRLYEKSPLMRSLAMVNYTFAKRLSHTADSQDQRHRTLPAARPLLMYQDTKMPDFITPTLIRGVGAEDEYSKRMQKLWGYKNKLLELGEDVGN